MKAVACEEILIAKMAELDGEALPSEEVERHFRACEACRLELSAMRGVDELFRSNRRAEANLNVWSPIERRISRKIGWSPFVLIAVILVVCKIVEMSLKNDPGLLFGLVPIAVAAALFVLLRENPFRVNPELAMEK